MIDQYKKSMSLLLSSMIQMKYILVTGGVISGIGKGILASSIGTLVRSNGFRVTSIKVITIKKKENETIQCMHNANYSILSLRLIHILILMQEPFHHTNMEKSSYWMMEGLFVFWLK